MSKFPKKRWDKITNDLTESFNAWLKNERHQSIYSFIIEHMTKLGAMLVKHKAESNVWKGIIRPKIEEKVKINIAKWEVYLVSPFMETFYVVFVGDLVLNVDIKERSYTCCGWKMSSIPCDHACTILLSIGQNVADFVDEIFKSPTQKLVYSSTFHGIETHYMPKVQDEGVVQDVIGNEFFFLKPPHTKRSPRRPRKKCIESQFQDKHTAFCSRCNMAGHNRRTCKNPLA